MNNDDKWTPVSSDILNEYENSEKRDNNIRVAEGRKDVINATLNDFGFDTQIEDWIIGPNVTRYNIRLKQNVSIRSLSSIVMDIQVRLGGVLVRLDVTSPGQSTVGLEIENDYQETVSFKELYDALPKVEKYPLAIPLGKRIDGENKWIDLAQAPHVLVAGTTGSGKSMLEESIICSLMMRNSPDKLRLLLIDPKKIQFNRYNDAPHLLRPIIRDVDAAKKALEQLCEEMEKRYTAYCEFDCCSFDEYNEAMEEKGYSKIPYIVVVIDEYADLVDQDKTIANPVISLAQKARAAGIHLIVATQRPATNVISGVLKANLPTHIALMMSNVVDSMTVIGEGGAEKLAGMGDMLVQSPLVSKLGVLCLQGCYIHRTEITRVVSLLKEKYKADSEVELKMIPKDNNRYLDIVPKLKKISADETLEDETRYQAVKVWVMTQEYMSISRIQRECSIGFNRAGRYFLRLQEEGIVDKVCQKQGCPVLKHNENK